MAGRFPPKDGEQVEGDSVLYLEPFSPIARAPLGVGNGDDLDVVQAFAEDHREGIAVEDHSAGSMQVERTYFRMVPNEVEGRNQFFEKTITGLKTLSAIPVVR